MHTVLRAMVPLLLIVAGCAAAMEQRPRPVSVGLAQPGHLTSRTPLLLDRHGFVVDRADHGGSSYRLATHWKTRDPFADELEQGVTEAKLRLVVWGHLRDTDLVGVYRVTLEFESLIRNGSSGEWAAAARTPMHERYLRAIASDFRAEFDTGAHLRPR